MEKTKNGIHLLRQIPLISINYLHRPLGMISKTLKLNVNVRKIFEIAKKNPK
jgi:hypothetical protein